MKSSASFRLTIGCLYIILNGVCEKKIPRQARDDKSGGRS